MSAPQHSTDDLTSNPFSNTADRSTHDEQKIVQASDSADEASISSPSSPSANNAQQLPATTATDEMTMSYTEISSLRPSLNPDGSTKPTHPRPISLEYGEQSSSSSSQHPPPPLPSSRVFPYNIDGGTVSVAGTQTCYVAEDLEYKIKLASPVVVSRFVDDMSSTTATTSDLLPRKFFQQVVQQQSKHQIDVNVLADVEIEAQYLAANVDTLTENLGNLLHSVSSLTADNVEAYKQSVHKLTDCMDGNIKSMYTIMAKTEEISNAMRPTEQLAGRM